jgi:hypothetical protein
MSQVVVLARFRVAKDGIVWRPDEVAEVDDAIAQRWERYGYVTVVAAVPEQPAERRKRSREQPDEQPDEW